MHTVTGLNTLQVPVRTPLPPNIVTVARATALRRSGIQRQRPWFQSLAEHLPIAISNSLSHSPGNTSLTAALDNLPTALHPYRVRMQIVNEPLTRGA